MSDSFLYIVYLETKKLEKVHVFEFSNTPNHGAFSAMNSFEIFCKILFRPEQ